MEHFIPDAHPMNNAAEVSNLVRCDRCGDDKLAWKKSSRTGRWYLCDVQKCDRWYTRESPTFRYFVLARLPHRCPERPAPPTTETAVTLTAPMKQALDRLARDEPINAIAKTITALKTRGLITENTKPHDGRGWRNLYMLTATGRHAAS